MLKLAMTAPTLGLAALFVLSSSQTQGAAPKTPVPSGDIRFERNAGQVSTAFDFIAHGRRAVALISAGRVLMGSGAASVEMSLQGSNLTAEATPESQLPLRTSYFLGGDPDRWYTGAENYERVRYREIYPGVDVVYYARDDQLEYDFVVAPGVSPSVIRLEFSGAEAVEIADSGDLVLHTDAGEIRQSKPVAYQELAGTRKTVSARFERLEAESVGFHLGPYDRGRPLVIDPPILVSTYIGGSGFDRATAVAIDALDDIWVGGETNSTDFPVPVGLSPPTLQGDIDIFLACFERDATPDGEATPVMTQLVFIGGSGRELLTTLNIDDEGLIHLVGTTSSTDFPVTPDATQTTYGGGALDMFFMVLRPGSSTSALAPEGVGGPIFDPPEMDFATFLGGDGADDTTAAGQTLNLTTTSGGDEFSSSCTFNFGITDSTTFSSTVAGRSERRGPTDGLICAFCKNRPNQTPKYLKTFAGLIGGNDLEFGGDVVVLPDGTTIAATYTFSKDLPVPSNAIGQPNPGSNVDAFFQILDPIVLSLDGTFSYQQGRSTYLGADGDEFMARLTVIEQSGPGQDPTFFPIISIASTSETAPIPDIGGVPFDQPNPGGVTPFVAIVNSTLTGTLGAKWVGGSRTDLLSEIVYDPVTGCLTFFGLTDSDLDLSENGFQTDPGEGFEGFIKKDCLSISSDYDPENPDPLIFADGFESGDTSAWSNLSPDDSGGKISRKEFGGSNDDVVWDVATTSTGTDVFVGQTSPPIAPLTDGNGRPNQGEDGFPTTDNAPQPTPGGGISDGFLMEVFIPLLRHLAILGAADFQNRDLSPGQIITLFATSAGPNQPVLLTLDENGRATTQLGPTRVLFDGVPSPMVSTTRNQVSAIVPFGVEGQQTTSIVLQVDEALSNPVRFDVAETTPAIFAADATGSGPGAILNQDFSVNTEANPAPPGSVIQIFMTGGGQTTIPGRDGEIVPLQPPFPRLLANVGVAIGGLAATVTYTGSAPGLIWGVVQVNAVVTGVEGIVPIKVSIGEAESQDGITVAVNQGL